MLARLKGLSVAMLGGDAREVILAESLVEAGVHLKVAGLPVPAGSGRHIDICADIPEAIAGVKAVILPVPGINEHGHVYAAHTSQPMVLSEEVLSCLPAGTPVLVGVAKKYLREIAGKCRLRLIEIMEMDQVAILNSIPSAEGAVQLAMENSPITIHGSMSFVIGFGRTGKTLAGMLRALKSNVTVVARNAAQRARAVEMGLGAVDFPVFRLRAGEADFLYNSVPAMVIDKEVLSVLSPEALIIDLASPPGGTDFEAAGRLSRKAILAPGLPGKVAPKTAGKILAGVVPQILAESISLY